MNKPLSKLLTLLPKAGSFLACAAVGYHVASTWNQPLWTTGTLILWTAPIAVGLSAAYFLYTLANRISNHPPSTPSGLFRALQRRKPRTPTCGPKETR